MELWVINYVLAVFVTLSVCLSLLITFPSFLLFCSSFFHLFESWWSSFLLLLSVSVSFFLPVLHASVETDCCLRVEDYERQNVEVDKRIISSKIQLTLVLSQMFHLFAKKQFIFPSSKVINSIPIGHPQFAAKYQYCLLWK